MLIHHNEGTPQHEVGGIPSLDRKTNTENTTKTLTDISTLVHHSSSIPLDFVQQNGLGTFGTFITKKIHLWCQKLSDVLVTEAMKKAVECSKTTWNYVEVILMNWYHTGIRFLEQVEAAVKAFQEQRNRKGNTKRRYSRKPIRTEELSDWYEGVNANDTKEVVSNDEDFDFKVEKAELLAELGQGRAISHC
jgi:DnaD/phage-associated family protein